MVFRKEGRGSLNTRFSERMKGGSEMTQIAETGRNPMEVLAKITSLGEMEISWRKILGNNSAEMASIS